MKRRTTIEVDDVLIDQAKAVLGTSGLKDTVDGALTEVIRAARRRSLANRLATGEGLDLDEKTTAAARQWRM